MEKPRQTLPNKPRSLFPPFKEVVSVCYRMKGKSTLININNLKGLVPKSSMTSFSNPPLIVHTAISKALKTLQSRQTGRPEGGGSPQGLRGVHVGPAQPPTPDLSQWAAHPSADSLAFPRVTLQPGPASLAPRCTRNGRRGWGMRNRLKLRLTGPARNFSKFLSSRQQNSDYKFTSMSV